MNVQEATKKALEIGGFITCARWPYHAIKPTDTPDCCIAHGAEPCVTRSPAKRWQPQAEDLIADDWEVVKTTAELPLQTCTPS